MTGAWERRSEDNQVGDDLNRLPGPRTACTIATRAPHRDLLVFSGVHSPERHGGSSINVRAAAEPPTGHMEFTIDFRRDAGSVARVFAATHDFIVMCEKIDEELGRCVGLTTPPSIEVVRVELDSIRTFLRQVLERTEDSEIQDQGVRAFVHSFLIVGKHSLLEFFDASDHRQEWERAVKRIHAAGHIGRPNSLPPFRPPRREKLLDTVVHYKRMKGRLKPGDQAYLEAGDFRHRVRRSVRVDPQTIEELKVASRSDQTYTTTVTVKKPDFLGNSKWDVYFNGQLVKAAIEDDSWLRRYQEGGVEMRPQDGLTCRLRVEESYGRDGRWLFTRYYIQKVLDVVPDPAGQ